MHHFPAVKFYMHYEKNMSFLVIPKSPKVRKKVERSRHGLLSGGGRVSCQSLGLGRGWLPLWKILSHHFAKYLHAINKPKLQDILESLFLFFKQTTQWNSEIQNFFSKILNFHPFFAIKSQFFRPIVVILVCMDRGDPNLYGGKQYHFLGVFIVITVGVVTTTSRNTWYIPFLKIGSTQHKVQQSIRFCTATCNVFLVMIIYLSPYSIYKCILSLIYIQWTYVVANIACAQSFPLKLWYIYNT